MELSFIFGYKNNNSLSSKKSQNLFYLIYMSKIGYLNPGLINFCKLESSGNQPLACPLYADSGKPVTPASTANIEPERGASDKR